MNKKQFAILSTGNISNLDEGIALYTSKYLASNYSFSPSVDIIDNSVEDVNYLNVLTQYEEVLVLDAIGIEDDPGSIYQFPMPQFRNLGPKDKADESGVLECLNLLEARGDTLPEVSLLAIVPAAVDKEKGLSPALHHSFEAFLLMVTKTLENKGFIAKENEEVQTLDSVIERFVSGDLA